MKRKEIVIILGIDHHNTLGLVRALGVAGFLPWLVLISDKKNNFVGASKYVHRINIVKTIDEGISFLKKIDTPSKIAVLTGADFVATALDRHFDELSDKFFLQNAGMKQGQLAYWTDKRNMLVVAERCGLNIPFTRKVNVNDPIDFKDLPYPCLLKSVDSSIVAKESFRKCLTPEDAIKAFDELKTFCPNILLQEYIEKDFECLAYGCRTKKDIIIAGFLKKLSTCTDTKNYGMLSFGYVSEDIPSQIGRLDNIKSFLESIDYYGLFSVEFMITKEKAYFLEANLRNDGTSFAFTSSGVNIPAIWVSSLNENVDSDSIQKRQIKPKIYSMNGINYLKYTFSWKHPWIFLKDLLKTDTFSILSIKDPKPFIYKVFNNLIRR